MCHHNFKHTVITKDQPQESQQVKEVKHSSRRRQQQRVLRAFLDRAQYRPPARIAPEMQNQSTPRSKIVVTTNGPPQPTSPQLACPKSEGLKLPMSSVYPPAKMTMVEIRLPTDQHLVEQFKQAGCQLGDSQTLQRSTRMRVSKSLSENLPTFQRQTRPCLYGAPNVPSTLSGVGSLSMALSNSVSFTLLTSSI